MWDRDRDALQPRGTIVPTTLAALGNAALAAWAAGTGAALLDAQPRAVLGVGTLAFILTLVASLRGA